MKKAKVLTQKNFEERFLQIKLRSMPIVTSFNVPVRTGKLRDSFRYDNTPDGFEITTDLFYMPFTNEPWVSPRWNGRENPNLYWFQENAEYIARLLARHLGGTYVKVK